MSQPEEEATFPKPRENTVRFYLRPDRSIIDATYFGSLRKFVGADTKFREVLEWTEEAGNVDVVKTSVGAIMGKRERERVAIEILRKRCDKIDVDFVCIGAAGTICM
jgi:hypothetical protein